MNVPTLAKSPNPRRVAAGLRNRALRKGLTEAGRRRLQEAARENKPWLHSTGPRSAAGKAQCVRNGKKRQLGPLSVREVRAELAGLQHLVEQMRDCRRSLV
jgi:hypothetical protein